MQEFATTSSRRFVERKVHKAPSLIPSEILGTIDAIVVLGGGTPNSARVPPAFVQNRCDAAISSWDLITQAKQGKESKNYSYGIQGSSISIPYILTLSAGTAHVPNLLSPGGHPIYESTASAAYIIDQTSSSQPNMHKWVVLETTSYDTISNAYFARTSHCDVAGWKSLLIITSQFHMARTISIFDWIFGCDNENTAGYNLHYLATPDVGLTEEEIISRVKRELTSKNTVDTFLSKKYATMHDVWWFLTNKHDRHSAKGLVQLSEEDPRGIGSVDNSVIKSYGGTLPNANYIRQKDNPINDTACLDRWSLFSAAGLIGAAFVIGHIIGNNSRKIRSGKIV